MTRSSYSNSWIFCISKASSLLAGFSAFISFQAAFPAPFPKVTLCFLLEVFGIYFSHCVPQSRQGKELHQCFGATVSSQNPSGVKSSLASGPAQLFPWGLGISELEAVFRWDISPEYSQFCCKMPLTITIITAPRAFCIRVPTQLVLNNYLHVLVEKTVISLFQQFSNVYNINPLFSCNLQMREHCPKHCPCPRVSPDPSLEKQSKK